MVHDSTIDGLCISGVWTRYGFCNTFWMVHSLAWISSSNMACRGLYLSSALILGTLDMISRLPLPLIIQLHPTKSDHVVPEPFPYFSLEML